MTHEQAFQEECHVIRLLVEEYKSVGAEYLVRNADSINAIEAYPNNSYIEPKVVHNISLFLAGALLFHSISLLEFRMPRLVVGLLISAGHKIPPELETFDEGNIIDWMKAVFKTVNGVAFDFGNHLTERVAAWIRVRNDLVHNGGYRSSRTKQRQIDILQGIAVGDAESLYYVHFSACERAIDDIEAFFRQAHDSILRVERISD